MRDQTLYLKDITDYAGKAIEFTKGITLSAFLADEKTCLAVIRCIEVIGEAAGKLDDNIRAHYPEIPWKSVANMRNILIHNYAGVDLEKVWDTVMKDIPELLKRLKEKDGGVGRK